MLPQSAAQHPPFPALVLLHTSNGQGAQDWLYAQRLRERGSRSCRVDARIGVMGFSKGGIAALYAAFRPVTDAGSRDGRSFALHLAYYPWCGLRLRDPLTTGAPVLIQTGALDDLVPPQRCAGLIAASRGPKGSCPRTRLRSSGAPLASGPSGRGVG